MAGASATFRRRRDGAQSSMPRRLPAREVENAALLVVGCARTSIADQATPSHALPAPAALGQAAAGVKRDGDIAQGWLDEVSGVSPGASLKNVGLGDPPWPARSLINPKFARKRALTDRILTMLQCSGARPGQALQVGTTKSTSRQKSAQERLGFAESEPRAPCLGRNYI